MRKVSKSMWLRRVGPLSLAGALVLPLALEGAEQSKPAVSSEQQEYFESSKTAKQKFFDDIEESRRNAMLQAGEGGAENYKKAIAQLESLVKKLQETSGEMAREKAAVISGNIQRIKSVWSSEVMQEAQQYAKDKKYREALAAAQTAKSITPDQQYISNFITECEKYISAGTFREDTSLKKVDDKYEERQKQLDIELREAKILFRNKRYEAVCAKLERVLLIDPFNVDAVELLALTYDRLYQIGVDRSLESIAIENARNSWEWSEPVTAVQRDETTSEEAQVRKPADNTLQARLDNIIFPTVPLENSTVDAIITYLNMESRRIDGQGVTIVSRLSDQERNRVISFNIPGKMPLSDILRYLSLKTGIPYSLQGDTVVFGDTNNMVTERFHVRSNIINEITQAENQIATDSGMKGPEEGGGGDDAPEDEGNPPTLDDIIPEEGNAGAGAGAGANAMGEITEATTAGTQMDAKTRNAKLKTYFSERMIPFENGASIQYSPRSEQLIVRNTPENLRRMDALLRQMDALEHPMIMIEAKLIELTDTNLNELGFEWMFSAKPASGKGWNMGTVDPTRHGNNGEMFRVLNNLKILPNFGEKIFGSDVKVDLSLSINAVAQNRRAEVLASPRILSVSDPKEPAMIKMTEKTYFITEWEQPDVETDGFNITLDSTDPDWDDAQDLGVTFKVTPKVMSDNYTISLKNINPIFLSHVADYHYIVSYEAGVYENGTMTPMMTQTFDLRMPEIARREMTTSITLYDGETVLIGGMADNESVARDDKWPILGDIPLLGRFFQDQQTNVTNRTMLIFITARLVNSNGVPMRSVRDRGLIEFNR
ncbi:MAG: hypothetical protein E7047_05175 [Lentisphaerae bacterium]|nr:hypothetical protein [Lentisphaerota bacterium]